MDTVLRLFDSTGNELAANDNFTGLYSRLDYTFPAPAPTTWGSLVHGTSPTTRTSRAAASPAAPATIDST